MQIIDNSALWNTPMHINANATVSVSGEVIVVRTQ